MVRKVLNKLEVRISKMLNFFVCGIRVFPLSSEEV